MTDRNKIQDPLPLPAAKHNHDNNQNRLLTCFIEDDGAPPIAEILRAGRSEEDNDIAEELDVLLQNLALFIGPAQHAGCHGLAAPLQQVHNASHRHSTTAIVQIREGLTSDGFLLLERSRAGMRAVWGPGRVPASAPGRHVPDLRASCLRRGATHGTMRNTDSVPSIPSRHASAPAILDATTEGASRSHRLRQTAPEVAPVILSRAPGQAGDGWLGLLSGSQSFSASRTAVPCGECPCMRAYSHQPRLNVSKWWDGRCTPRRIAPHCRTAIQQGAPKGLDDGARAEIRHVLLHGRAGLLSMQRVLRGYPTVPLFAVALAKSPSAVIGVVQRAQPGLGVGRRFTRGKCTDEAFRRLPSSRQCVPRAAASGNDNEQSLRRVESLEASNPLTVSPDGPAVSRNPPCPSATPLHSDMRLPIRYLQQYDAYEGDRMEIEPQDRHRRARRPTRTGGRFRIAIALRSGAGLRAFERSRAARSHHLIAPSFTILHPPGPLPTPSHPNPRHQRLPGTQQLPSATRTPHGARRPPTTLPHRPRPAPLSRSRIAPLKSCVIAMTDAAHAVVIHGMHHLPASPDGPSIPHARKDKLGRREHRIRA
ncbi:hypothetical protein EVG20_g10128 [Dentipellis fragilis]|uniref:Uncharacterized protein n=1 Tax=Dentipellis fragilis TaxID=205917 RepID=A0A4Y9XTE4_9AGAM|nr:hypothetical protein EVG20_g10128 [Dentipellis fragilis]